MWACANDKSSSTTNTSFPSALEPRRELAHALVRHGFFEEGVEVARRLLADRIAGLGHEDARRHLHANGFPKGG